MPTEKPEPTRASEPETPTGAIPKTTAEARRATNPTGTATTGGGTQGPHKTLSHGVTFAIGVSGRTRRRPRP